MQFPLQPVQVLRMCPGKEICSFIPLSCEITDFSCYEEREGMDVYPIHGFSYSFHVPLFFFPEEFKCDMEVIKGYEHAFII